MQQVKSNKDAGYEINIRKFVAFPHTSNELAERLINQFHFTTASTKIKYKKSSTMEVKTCTLKPLRRLIKEIEEDTRKWRDTLRSGIGRINIVYMSILLKDSTYSIQSLSNFPLHFLQK